MSLKIIGAGYGRTGTKSLQSALEILGFGKCYHMEELIANPEGVIHWEAADKGEKVDWNKLFQNYQAIVDFPGSIHYKDLTSYYEDSKVILTIRDPEKWYASAYSTIFNFDPGITIKLKLLFSLPFSKTARKLLRVIKLIDFSIWKKYFKGRFKDKAYAIQRFNDHIEEVKKTIPSERLLIFQVKDGWEPLCDFLGVEIPSEQFPSSNQKESFHENARNLVLEMLDK